MDSNKILIIGDALEDIYYICNKPSRRSAEVDIPINDVQNVEVFGGGAANIAFNLERLGFETEFLYGVNANMGVPQKCRIYSDGKQVARFDLNDRVDPIWDEFLDINFERRYNAVVVGDYGKGSVNSNVRDRVIEYCEKWAIPLFVHTKSNPALWWTANNKLTTVFCNWSEYKKAESQYSLFENLVITKGPKGARLYKRGKESKYIIALAPRVVDVNGAGDVFMATYIARAVGTPLVSAHLPSALAYASVAAAIAIQRPYTSYIDFQELKEGWYEYNNSKTPTSE